MSYENISEHLRTATRSLPVGAMVSSSEFRLEDAMSSIELMEPKMDPGCGLLIKEENYRELKNKVTSVSLSEAGQCRVADALIGQLFAWLTGHLYIQTVHGCLFMVEKDALANRSLSAFCGELLRTCCHVRQFVMVSSVADDEDFIGYMFGFNEEVKDAPPLSPEILTSGLSLRVKFLSLLVDLLTSMREPKTEIAGILKELLSVITQIEGTLDTPLSPTEAELIESSVDPSFHRNLLPPGPPRVVPRPKSSSDIMADWRDLFRALSGCLDLVESDGVTNECDLLYSVSYSPFTLVNQLGELRRIPFFRNIMIRAFMYHRMSALVPMHEVVVTWLSACCGGSLPTKDETIDAFVTDMVTVLNRAVHCLFRTSARQHRSLKSVLSDLCIMQHRAWDISTNGSNTAAGPVNPKGLWSFTAMVASTLIQVNLILNIELDLVDLRSEETCVLFFLIEQVTNVKMFVLNELLSTLRSAPRVNQAIANAIRVETVVSAIENSFAASALLSASKAVCRHALRTPEQDEHLVRVFELRSGPLRAFPLPKLISLDEYFDKVSNLPTTSLHDCLMWMEKATKLFGHVRGVLIGPDLSLAKKTVVNNKLMAIKGEGKRLSLQLKYHWIVPCVAVIDL